MAEGRLIRAAAIAAVLALGVTAAALAPAASFALTVADLVAGVAIGVGGAWLLDRARLPALLALATCVAWFAGTLGVLGATTALAYRGPLLHLVSETVAGRWIAAAGWIGAFLPLTLARPVTAAVAALTACLAATQTRRVAADRRRALIATAASAGVLAGIWVAPILGAAGTLLTLANDLAVVAAAAVALATASGLWTRAAASELIVTLGRARHPGRPVTAELARALADPDLELRYAVPGLGWVDEHGRAVEAPEDNGRPITRAAAPGGGEVALIHGGSADPRLAAAATAAAALTLDAARLEAQLHSSAADVRASRRRLLTAAADERRALEARLNDRVLPRLRRVNGLLGEGDQGLRDELRAAIDDLAVLGRGLYPPAEADLAQALTELASRTSVPTSVEVSGSADLPDGHRAALWFICAEALANVDKHAGAAHVRVRLRAGQDSVALELRDDGRGGATPERGLRGIADRVDALGGTFSLTSPHGGPTVLRAELPLSATRSR